jgi:hypothetical protein
MLHLTEGFSTEQKPHISFLPIPYCEMKYLNMANISRPVKSKTN